MNTKPAMLEQAVQIPTHGVMLVGDLAIPDDARGLVLFVHGSGSSRLSPRNQLVAQILREGGFGTLLFDLLTEGEDQTYARRFDINLLTKRTLSATQWVRIQEATGPLPLGFFGASTGAAAALQAAAELGEVIGAVVSRGGRPDLALTILPLVRAPTLLIVGGEDHGVIELNQAAHAALRCVKELAIVPGATHLFEEPGALEEVAQLAREWFQRYLVRK